MKHIKEIINALKKSWKYKWQIVSASLFVALIFPVGVDIVKEFIPTTEARYEKEYTQIDNDLVARTKEIHASMIKTAFFYALQERNNETNIMMNYSEEDINELLSNQ